MFHNENTAARNAIVRLAGLGLLVCCYLAVSWLFADIGLRAEKNATMLDYLAAACGFWCLTSGAALTMLGTHIFDQVQISERWSRKSCAPPALESEAATVSHVREDSRGSPAFASPQSADRTNPGTLRAQETQRDIASI